MGQWPSACRHRATGWYTNRYKGIHKQTSTWFFISDGISLCYVIVIIFIFSCMKQTTALVNTCTIWLSMGQLKFMRASMVWKLLALVATFDFGPKFYPLEETLSIASKFVSYFLIAVYMLRSHFELWTLSLWIACHLAVRPVNVIRWDGTCNFLICNGTLSRQLYRFVRAGILLDVITEFSLVLFLL